MPASTRDLTKAQWEILNLLIPEPTPRKDGRGRAWKDLASRLERHFMGAAYGCSLGRRSRPLSLLPDLPQTVSAMGSLRSNERISGGSCTGLKVRGVLDVEEAFIDGSFASAKKGVPKLEKQNVAREPKSWQSRTVMVFRLPSALKAPLLTKLISPLLLDSDRDSRSSSESDRRQRL
jgi:hypothetical protein